MSTKASGRRRKQPEKAQEDVIGSEEVVNEDKEITEKKSTNRRKNQGGSEKPQIENNIDDTATKASRGRKKREASSDETNTKKGKQKKLDVKVDPVVVQSPVQEVDKENKETVPEEKSEEIVVTKKIGGTRRKQNGDKNSEIEVEVTAPVKEENGVSKKSKGKKKQDQKQDVETEDVASNGLISIEEKSEAPLPKKGRARKVDKEEPPIEEKPEEKKSKRGKKKQAVEDDVQEKKQSVKTAAAKKVLSVGGRSSNRKRGAIETKEETTDKAEVVDPKEEEAETTSKPKIAKRLNQTKTSYDKLDFSTDKKFNFKISSWNVAGLRAWINKGGQEFIENEKPDIICLQEIKCVPDDVPDEARIPGYHPYWLCKPGGYAGVAIYSKVMPINVEYGIGNNEQDEDGRILTAEYEKFYLICVYVPNSGRKLVTLPKRLRWNEIFDKYVTELNAKKPVIISGDMNVSHNEIDLANPKANKRNAGFTQEERDGMTKLLSLGYIDTFRHFNPNLKDAYTYWTYMGNARSRNVGWRLDYFIVSERIISKVVDSVIRSKVLGSDHCPITLLLNI